MKRILGIGLLSLLVLVGCTETENAIGGVFEPIIGTWNASVAGVETTMVFNADESCSETTTIVGVGTSKTGTWDANDTTITRVFSDASTDTLYYSFNSDTSEMTVSTSAGGLATVFTEE